MNEIKLSQIKNDLKFLKNFNIVVYGSFLTDYYIPYRSDIDIAIITFKLDKEKNINLWSSVIGKAPSCYDIRIFELLPLYIKIEIINNHYVLFGNELEISEYFYFYRKEWNYVKKRIEQNQFKNLDEQLIGIERRKFYQF